MKKVGIALVGYGVIGSGVIEILQDHESILTSRTGISFELLYIVDKDLTSPRRVQVKSAKLTDKLDEALNDPAVQIVVELVGGTGFAYTLIEQSLLKNKNVVTANKALLAERGLELFALASKHHKAIGFEASVCGGIPIIRTLNDSLVGDKVNTLYGIVNGTTNYILTKMMEENLDFKTALSQAQKLGFAEADPTLDIGGHDAAHKIAILAALAFNTPIDYSKVHTEGIQNMDLDDIKNAVELGYVIKLLAVAKLDDDKSVEVRVNPTLVPTDNQLAFVRNEFNAVLVSSEFLGDSMYYGRGAGSKPTASAVIADIVEIAKFIDQPEKTTKYLPFETHPLKAIGDIESRYYLKINVLDKPGVLSRISGIFGTHNISIASLIQNERSQTDHVPLVLTTHTALEKNFKQALKEIEQLEFVRKPVSFIRIID